MLKLCIACSSKVAASSRTCSCGHVFSPETRRIGGKRFSGYRLGTTRRQSFSTLREKQQNGAIMNSDPPAKKLRKPVLCQNVKSPPKAVRVRSRMFSDKHIIKRKGHQISKENQAKAKVRKIDHIMQVLSSPERRLKLSLALAEINRRLASQMLIWKMLPCETG